MPRIHIAWIVLLVAQAPALAQTGIHGHYADGQVWIAWEPGVPAPDTYAIYRATAPFTDISQADLMGRLYPSEWEPAAIRDQLTEMGVSGFTNWVIPNATGGTTTLPAGEALFVDTVDQGPDGTRWYGVVAWGDTVVAPGVNLVAVNWTFDAADPPECHLQLEELRPTGHAMRVYSLWAHGENDHRAGRPDFPVMGNQHKNGMPSMFLLFEGLSLGTPPHPVTYWLHGGGGVARTSHATGRPKIDIEPRIGLLVAHNDDFQRPFPTDSGWVLGDYEETNTWWFGYAEAYDPFAPSFEPAAGDTIINYTQRRLLWTHAWLIQNEDVDPDRAALQGHSMGSVGSTHLGKCFPDLFSTVTIYNNGFHGPTDTALPSTGSSIFGMPALDLPTNLRRGGNQVVRAYDLFDLTTRTSAKRDLPLFRSFHGKNDTGGPMEWDAETVAEYRAADALGTGAHLYWDLRDHGFSGPNPIYWTESGQDHEQTGRDDVADQERYRASQSYPAFFNHQAQPDSITGDPGDGTPGNVSGDDWGTWGGYHEWDLGTIEDTENSWEAVVYLIDSLPHPRDTAPHESLASDVAIRRPQAFRPPPGSLVHWSVLGALGDTLQAGQETVGPDGLVVAQGVIVARDPDRRTLRFVAEGAVGFAQTVASPSAVRVFPNPFRENIRVSYALDRRGRVDLNVFDVAGRRVARVSRPDVGPGGQSLTWTPAHAGPGVYFLELRVDGMRRTTRRVVKLD